MIGIRNFAFEVSRESTNFFFEISIIKTLKNFKIYNFRLLFHVQVNAHLVSKCDLMEKVDI